LSESVDSQIQTAPNPGRVDYGVVALKTAKESSHHPAQTLWEFADLGFDTQKKLWSVQLFDSLNANVGYYTAKKVILNGGCAIQYQWKDAQGSPAWHVRERFLATEVESFQIDVEGNLAIEFKKRTTTTNNRVESEKDAVPPGFKYLVYAYHLRSKESHIAPMGFVEFYDEANHLIRRINNKWIIVEDVPRKTIGEFPGLRISVEGKDIEKINVTRSSIVIIGREKGMI